jgi:broad specificity phosphatase PhoE
MAGVGLSPAGHEQASRLAEQFTNVPIDFVESSPRQRARETAQPIAGTLHLPLRINPDMDEIDFGEWSGASFARLDDDPRWHDWNGRRATSRPPRGESMRELQIRVVDHLERVRRSGKNAVIVSHAEPIRAAILYYREVSLDAFASIAVDPASVIVLNMNRTGVHVDTREDRGGP